MGIELSRTGPSAWVIGVFVLAVAAGSADRCAAQVPDFFDRDGTAYDPEISVVNSGAILDAQAVVSHDRRYVTLNMRASNTSLLALEEFSFAQRRNDNNDARRGFVGGVGARPATKDGDAGAAEGAGTSRKDDAGQVTSSRSSPSAIRAAAGSVLDRPGMTRLD